MNMPPIHILVKGKRSAQEGNEVASNLGFVKIIWK